VEFQGGRHSRLYAFASWGRLHSAWGGVEHTDNGTTMEDLECYALVVSKGFLREDGRHSKGWRMYSTAYGITLKKGQGWLDAWWSLRKQEMSCVEDVMVNDCGTT